MRSLVVLLLVALLSLMPVVVCIGHETAADAGGSGAVGETILDDWEVDINVRSGLIWNAESEQWRAYLSWPFCKWKDVSAIVGFEVDPPLIEYGPSGAIVGLTWYLGNARDWGIDLAWAEHLGLNIGPAFRYDFETEVSELSIVMSVFDVSIGEKRKR